MFLRQWREAKPSYFHSPSRRRLCRALALGLSMSLGPSTVLVAKAKDRKREREADDAPFVWPASGIITSYFGEVGSTSPRGHAGLDISAPWGTPVVAPADGSVELALTSGGPYGTYLVIDHGDGLKTLCAHLSELAVEEGERVEKGKRIGRIGTTGYTTGPHLHFEVRRDGVLRDPLELLPA